MSLLRVRCQACQVVYVASYENWKERACSCPECRSTNSYGLQHPRSLTEMDPPLVLAPGEVIDGIITTDYEPI